MSFSAIHESKFSRKFSNLQHSLAYRKQEFSHDVAHIMNAHLIWFVNMCNIDFELIIVKLYCDFCILKFKLKLKQ